MSRLRKNIATIFDVFAEVAAPRESKADSPGSGEAWILWKYPEDYDDRQKLASITQFSFPSGVTKNQNEAVQLFSFVLTDESSRYTFGYCRFTPNSNTCLCILSGLPWTNLFYKLLNHIASVMNDKSEDELDALLVRAYHQEVPHPGDTFSVESSLGKNKLEVHCPDHTRLPTISDNRNLMEYYSAVNEDHMICIFASLLRERRVVFTGRKLSQLSSCVMAANMLIYPLHWQHIFIPVLPQKLFPYLSAPMPFLIGVSSSGLESAQVGLDLNELVILDIDKKTISSPDEDWKHLPPEVMSVLKSNLRRSNHMLGDGLARSFLRAMVVVLGGYRLGCVKGEDNKIHFHPDRFISEQPRLSPRLRDYLSEFRHLQIFAQFVEERLELLNEGGSLQDEFEAEVKVFEHKPSKHGGAKDLANPVALQQAYESVLEKGMGAWSDINQHIQGTMSKFEGRSVLRRLGWAQDMPLCGKCLLFFKKETSLKPQGVSPPNMRKIQRPLSAAGSMVKDKVNKKIPKYHRKTKHNREALENIDDGISISPNSSSQSHKEPGFIGLSDDLVDVGKEAVEEGGGRTEKLFSEDEMEDIMNKRTSILLRYDEDESNTEERVKSSKSLSDLLSLEIPCGDAVSLGSNSSSNYLPETTHSSTLESERPGKRIPWLSPTASRLSGGLHTSHSAADLLQRRQSPIQTPSPARKASPTTDLPARALPSTPQKDTSSLRQPLDRTGGENLIDLGPPKLDWKEVGDVMMFDPLLAGSGQSPHPPSIPPARVSSNKTSATPPAVPPKPNGATNNLELLTDLFMPMTGLNDSSVSTEPQKSVGQLRQQWEQFE